MKAFYVVLQRLYQERELVSIFSAEEALKCRWIDCDGNRVWVVPVTEEKTPTFVWGFDDLDQAIAFYEVLCHAELGIECEEV